MRSPFGRSSRAAGLRVLLVGHGARGRQWAAVCRRAGVALAGIVDPDPSALEAAAAGGVPTWPTLERALAEVDAAAAVVASPPGSHVGDARACVDGGLAVLLEKPAALALPDARVLEEAARSASRPVLVAQNFRFLPRERAVRSALAAGAIGRPVRVAVFSARPATAAAPHLASIRNGALWDIALHHLDALRGRFGEPVAVDASRSSLGADGSGELAIELEWPDGLRGAYRHVEGAPAFHHHEWIEGGEAALVVDGMRVHAARPGRRWSKVRPPRGPAPEASLLDALTAALAGVPDASLALSENLGTVALVEAADRSLASRARVPVADVRQAPAAAS